MTKTNIITITASVALVAITIATVNPTRTDAKKTVKLNKSKLTVQTGKTTKLKLQNTKKKVKWSSKNKKVATVNSNGVVKGIAVGKTTIIAKCNKKKYVCKVTVKLSATDQKIKNLEDKLNKVEEKVDATPTPVVTPEPTSTPVPTPTLREAIPPSKTPPTPTPIQEPPISYFPFD